MTIRNMQHYIDSIWDWSCLRGCFSGTIAPTDVDGLVERNGKFLLIETKEPGVPIPRGQQITHERLAATGVFTVMCVWGKPGQPQRIRVLVSSDGQVFVQETDTDLEGFRALVSRWFQYANRSVLTN